MRYLRLAAGVALIAAAAALAVLGRGHLRETLPGSETGAMWALWLAAYVTLDYNRRAPAGL